MDNRALSQRLAIIVASVIGLALAICAGWYVGSAQYLEMVFGFAIIFATSLALFSGRLFWVVTIASSFLGGTFPILGGSFTPFQVLMGIGVAKFVIEDIVLRRTRLKTGNKIDTLLLAGFMGVLFVHGLQDRFGMRFLGSSIWGGRHYINVFVGLIAFFVVQSIPTPSRVWAKLPYFVLAVTGFDLLIAIITTLFPATIYVIFPFYSAVSNTALQEIISGNTIETARVGAFGYVGFTLIVLVLSWVPLRRIIHPSNLFRLLVLVGGFIGVLVSSFRTSVLNGVIALITAGIRDLKWGVLLLLPALALLLFALAVVNSDFVHLPKQMQRSLAFMPGNWDIDMKRDASASNEFRSRVWRIWTREYFPLHPWLGRGFGFRREWAEGSGLTYGPYADVQMVEVGNIHNGLFAAVDAFGLVGTIFFVIWNARLLFRTFQVKFARNDPESVALRFLALYLAVLIIAFWAGAENVGSFLPRQFALAGVFLRLLNQDKSDSKKAQEAPKTQDIDVRPDLAVV
jgi:hypothetical protein